MHQSAIRQSAAANVMQGSEQFASWTDYIVAVRKAGLGMRDPRLVAASAVTKTSVGTDGGFAVPGLYGEQISNAVRSEKSLLTLCDVWFTERNTIDLPVDETTGWDTNGIQAHWVDEYNSIPQSKAELKNISMRLNKIAVLVPVSDEVASDALALSQYLQRKAPEKIDHAINLAIMRGTGAATPLGILNSPALVTVPKESAQAADSIVGANASKMLARLPAESFSNSVWLVHPDAVPQLPGMTLNDASIFTQAAGMPHGAIGLLLGRPVIPHQVCSTVGDLGDIVLADLTQYLAAVKIGGLKFQISIHLWFDREVSAFKFTLRILGQPVLSAPIAPRVGTMTQSPFVALAARD